MRIFFNSIPLLFVLLSLSALQVNAQTQYNERTIRTLELTVQRAEERVEEAKLRISEADSLINFGDSTMAKADENFFRIAEEVKEHNKSYRKEQKNLQKQTKSKNRELALKARSDLQELNKMHQTKLREYSIEIRDMRKLAQEGENLIRKGQMQRTRAMQSLKEAEKNLRDSRDKYDVAISTFGK